MSEEYDLLPCPFCGNEHPTCNDQVGIAWVSCDQCEMEGPPKDFLVQAMAAWNTRNGGE